MSKYIDADKLKKQIQFLIDSGYDNLQGNLYHVLSIIDSLQQEQPEQPKIGIAEYYYHKGVCEGFSKGSADALKILEEFMKRKADPVIVIKQQEQPEVDLEKAFRNEKQLLMKDVCARLHCGINILYTGWDSDRGVEYQTVEKLVGMDDNFIYTLWSGKKNKHSINFSDFKPYLRPMSSMTEEEKANLQSLHDIISDENYGDGYSPSAWDAITEWEDYCNARHLDYRGLIPMGLALEAPEGMYKTE